MKYPLDHATFNETVAHLVSHANMQSVIISKMTELLNGAMDASEHDEDDWYKDAQVLFEDLRKLSVDHESRRWNETNYQNQINAGAIKIPKEIPVQKMPPGEIKAVQDPVIAGLQSLQFDLHADLEANKKEAKFGEEMSEEELERLFTQKRTKKTKDKPKQISQMSLDEIESWEKSQDNSNDIYKIKARVANLARGGNASLTKQGDMLVNTYVHVLKALYDFADQIEDKTVKMGLIKIIRSNEGMPGNLIAAAGAGVTQKK